MTLPHHARPELSAHTRLGACLLHTVPGASGSIRTCQGEEYFVAHHRSDALTPCELRTLILQPLVPGIAHLAGMIRSIELVGGAVDTGGGLYRCSHPAAGDERWFVTTLDAHRVAGIADGCPESIDHRHVSVRVSADAELGVCAVCVSSDSAATSRLDDVARWLHVRCLVDELVEPLCVSHTA